MGNIRALYELLNPTNTLCANRLLAHNLGLDEALIYQALIAKYKNHSENNRLSDGDYFYSTVEDMWDSTTLTRRRQQHAINNLIKAGLIEMKRRGMPAKRFFRLNHDVKRLEKYLTASLCKSAQQEGEQTSLTKNNSTSWYESAQQVGTNQPIKLIHEINSKSNSSINQSSEDDGKIDDLIQTIKLKFNVELTHRQVNELMTVTNDLNSVLIAVEYVVNFAKSKGVKINKFVAYVKKTLINMNEGIEDVEFDAIQAAEDERAVAKEKTAEELKKVRAIIYSELKADPHSEFRRFKPGLTQQNEAI